MRKKVSFSLNVYLTTSKLAAYVILVIGTIFAFLYQDAGTLLATFSAVSAILMMKTFVTGRPHNNYHNNNYNDCNQQENNYTDYDKKEIG